MKVGLIPPRGLENFALQSKFHLALALPELVNRTTYAGMYARASALGDYVIMDNGLAEGHIIEPMDLRTAALKVMAKEIVAPDVMRDGAETVKAVRKYFTAISLESAIEVKYMGVAQGITVTEFQNCIEKLAGLQPIKVIGIPRHMLETVRKKPCRIDLANWINNTYPDRFEVHFLGTNASVWTGEVRAAAKYSPFVRSVDTSMPFTYAIANESLATTTANIIRPDGYFKIDWSRRVSASLIRKNIQTLMEWADATGSRSEASVSRVREVPAS
jgi:hypothetical protein